MKTNSFLDVLESSGGDVALSLVIVVLGGIGTYLLMPHKVGFARPRVAHGLGAGLVALGLLIMAWTWTAPGPWLSSLFFYVFAVAAVGSGVLTVTSRDPVYSALWFASVVLSTSGLFLLAGAQFLAAGTIIVYAGAIVVTFLFVIMLAQQGGQATYDRMARLPGKATFSCSLLFWALLYAFLVVKNSSPGVQIEKRIVRQSEALRYFRVAENSTANRILKQAVRPTSRLPESLPLERPEGATTPHLAGLAGTLYTDHLIAAELVGALLFVSLVGAVAVATPKLPVRPGDSRPEGQA